MKYFLMHVKKLKSTFLNITNCGLHDNGLNPITTLRIYNSVVLPKALYGCELWCDMSPTYVTFRKTSSILSEIYAKPTT